MRSDTAVEKGRAAYRAAYREGVAGGGNQAIKQLQFPFALPSSSSSSFLAHLSLLLVPPFGHCSTRHALQSLSLLTRTRRQASSGAPTSGCLTPNSTPRTSPPQTPRVLFSVSLLLANLCPHALVGPSAVLDSLKMAACR